MFIAVDFDGTCVTHEFPKVGKDIGAAPVLKRIIENGHKLILFTMRSNISNPHSAKMEIHPVGGKYLDDALKWFEDNDIELYGVNTNPEQSSWTHSPKAYAHLYIDDAALGCPLVRENGVIFVDWGAVEKILIGQGIISAEKGEI